MEEGVTGKRMTPKLSISRVISPIEGKIKEDVNVMVYKSSLEVPYREAPSPMASVSPKYTSTNVGVPSAPPPPPPLSYMATTPTMEGQQRAPEILPDRERTKYREVRIGSIPPLQNEVLVNEPERRESRLIPGVRTFSHLSREEKPQATDVFSTPPISEVRVEPSPRSFSSTLFISSPERVEEKVKLPREELHTAPLSELRSEPIQTVSSTVHSIPSQERRAGLLRISPISVFTGPAQEPERSAPIDSGITAKTTTTHVQRIIMPESQAITPQPEQVSAQPIPREKTETITYVRKTILPEVPAMEGSGLPPPRSVSVVEKTGREPLSLGKQIYSTSTSVPTEQVDVLPPPRQSKVQEKNLTEDFMQGRIRGRMEFVPLREEVRTVVVPGRRVEAPSASTSTLPSATKLQEEVSSIQRSLSAISPPPSTSLEPRTRETTFRQESYPIERMEREYLRTETDYPRYKKKSGGSFKEKLGRLVGSEPMETKARIRSTSGKEAEESFSRNEPPKSIVYTGSDRYSDRKGRERPLPSTHTGQTRSYGNEHLH